MLKRGEKEQFQLNQVFHSTQIELSYSSILYHHSGFPVTFPKFGYPLALHGYVLFCDKLNR